jgi:hypothetical protein
MQSEKLNVNHSSETLQIFLSTSDANVLYVCQSYELDLEIASVCFKKGPFKEAVLVC